MAGCSPFCRSTAAILIFTAMASLGLPGLGGFVSEFLVVRGAWPIFTLATALSMIGLFFTGAYILKALKLVLHGPLNERWEGHLTEISAREMVVIAPLDGADAGDRCLAGLAAGYDQPGCQLVFSER